MDSASKVSNIKKLVNKGAIHCIHVASACWIFNLFQPVAIAVIQVKLVSFIPWNDCKFPLVATQMPTASGTFSTRLGVAASMHLGGDKVFGNHNRLESPPMQQY